MSAYTQPTRTALSHLVKEEEGRVRLCLCVVQPRKKGVKVAPHQVRAPRLPLYVLEQRLAQPPGCLELLVLLSLGATVPVCLF